VQCDAQLGDVEANVRMHLEWIAKAKEKGVELLVFPELSRTGYLLQDMVPEVSLSVDDPVFRELGRAAAPMSLVVGAIEESSDHGQYIASLYIENGQVLHLHRKVYLATYGVFDEARYLGSGQRIRAADTRFGRLGLLVCEDAWHPSLVSTLLLDGANVLVVQVASPVRNLSRGELPQNARTWMDTLRTYARLYGSYIVFCNRVGSEDGLVFWGRSCLLGPDGEELSSAALLDEELIVGEIDLERVREARLASPILREEKLDITIRELQRIVGARVDSAGEGTA
jgi:predicted amidohydrolase